MSHSHGHRGVTSRRLPPLAGGGTAIKGLRGTPKSVTRGVAASPSGGHLVRGSPGLNPKTAVQADTIPGKYNMVITGELLP